MRATFAVFTLLLCAGCASAQQESSIDTHGTVLEEKDYPGVPHDAFLVADRPAFCNHLGREVNGDGSERDRDIARASVELRCDALRADVADIRKKYVANAMVEKVLEAADEF